MPLDDVRHFVSENAGEPDSERAIARAPRYTQTWPPGSANAFTSARLATSNE